ncbi:hypothetical protein [Streptobacillus moniliformis]|uniref:hypothetical protein n=1 Tax=Streptobacillus moniliformis TaxID=34105 RepID=UPI0007E3CBFA|nr:hypothetical protein [Streptobacillus moniliformis]
MKKSLLIFLLFMGIINFTKSRNERYRIESSVYYVLEKGSAGNNNSPGISFSISFIPEYKHEFSNKWSVTFGPKISLTGLTIKSSASNKMIGRGHIGLGIKGEGNFLINKNVKIYGGLELGTGVFIKQIESVSNIPHFGVIPLFRISSGVKVLDKYNIGIFTGYENRFVAGIEMGYIFK